MILNNSEFYYFFTKFRIFGKFLICFRKFDWKSDTRHYFLEFGAKSEKNSSKIRRKKCEIRFFAIESMKFINSIAIFFWRFLTKNWRIPRERCKGVHCVDLGESFPTSIYLQKSASIQPRTSPSKFTYVSQNLLHVLHVTLHATHVTKIYM